MFRILPRQYNKINHQSLHCSFVTSVTPIFSPLMWQTSNLSLGIGFFICIFLGMLFLIIYLYKEGYKERRGMGL